VKFESLTTQRFVELYLESIPLDDYITGAAQPKLNQKALNSIPIPAPPLAEQQRIVGLLDEAFEGLATAKANAEKNLQNARALFESHLQSVFTQRGPGWVEKNLGDLCQIKTGKKDVNEGNPDGKYPFFTCAAAHTFSANYSFDTEALLVAGNGNVGQVSYYSGKFEAYQRTYVLFDFKDVTAKYLFRVLDKRLSATVSKQKLGNTMPYIKIGMLTDFVVPVPPPKEQELVAESLGAIAEETQRLARLYERKHAALEALKKSLLHQAFTGAL
jgi:type I restriction enzyme S subunit